MQKEKGNGVRNFDLYEFTGILLPGSIFLLSLVTLYPELGDIFLSHGVNVGEFGFFMVIAYATGHVIQAGGNLVEFLWWKRGGMPTDWVRSGKGSLLHRQQISSLIEKVKTKCGYELPSPLSDLTAKEWYSITRQIYSIVQADGKAARVDMLNGNYGLNRGLTAALLTAGILTAIQMKWSPAIFLLLVGFVCLYRMHRFGRHYGRELFIEFLRT